jgi:hypothetical protein
MHALGALAVTFSMTMTIRGQSARRSKRVVARACSLTSAWTKEPHRHALFATYIWIHLTSRLRFSLLHSLIFATQLHFAQQNQRITTTKSFSSQVTVDAIAYTA